MLLHDAQELDHNLRRGADENLALTPALGVDNADQSVVLRRQHAERCGCTYQNRDADHCWEMCTKKTWRDQG